LISDWTPFRRVTAQVPLRLLPVWMTPPRALARRRSLLRKRPPSRYRLEGPFKYPIKHAQPSARALHSASSRWAFSQRSHQGSGSLRAGDSAPPRSLKHRARSGRRNSPPLERQQTVRKRRLEQRSVEVIERALQPAVFDGRDRVGLCLVRCTRLRRRLRLALRYGGPPSVEVDDGEGEGARREGRGAREMLRPWSDYRTARKPCVWRPRAPMHTN